jgi:hypothetical protein
MPSPDGRTSSRPAFLVIVLQQRRSALNLDSPMTQVELHITAIVVIEDALDETKYGFRIAEVIL